VQGSRRSLAVLGLTLAAAGGCGGDHAVPPSPPPPAAALRLEPAAAILRTGETLDFTAVGEGYGDALVVWAVAGAPVAGTIDSAGLYAAPGRAGRFEVVASDPADPQVRATASVEVRETYEARVAALEVYVFRSHTAVSTRLATSGTCVRSYGLALAPQAVWFAGGEAPLAAAVDHDGRYLGWCGRGMISLYPPVEGSTGWHDAGDAQIASFGTLPCQFDTVNDVAADGDGNLFVAAGNRVHRVDAGGNCVRVLTAAGSGQTLGVAWDVATAPGGLLYVFDSATSRVNMYDDLGNWLYGFGGAAQMSPFCALAVDARGDIFVADALYNRVRHLDGWGRLLGQWGSRGTSLLQLDTPRGVAVDGQGFVYVADAGNARVIKFTSDGAVMGRWDLYGGYQAAVRQPWGIGVAADGTVWVTDGSPETRRGNLLSYSRAAR